MKQKEKKLVESFNLGTELQDAIFDFIDMRTMIKKPMTERAIKMLVNKVLKMSDNDTTRIAIIDQSIMNNWLDIYPLKNNYQKQENNSDWETIY